MADPTKMKLRTPLRLGGMLGFIGGFLLAYQRSSSMSNHVDDVRHLTLAFTVRFWGWSENQREQEMDKEEMSERIRQGQPLYGHSDQPEWVQGAAYRNSVFSQLKFGEYTIHRATVYLCLHSHQLPSPCMRFHSYIETMQLIRVYRFNLVNHPYHGVDPSKYKKDDE